jgi:hypothetical protein
VSTFEVKLVEQIGYASRPCVILRAWLAVFPETGRRQPVPNWLFDEFDFAQQLFF